MNDKSETLRKVLSLLANVKLFLIQFRIRLNTKNNYDLKCKYVTMHMFIVGLSNPNVGL